MNLSKSFLLVQLNNFFRSHNLASDYDVISIVDDYKYLKNVAIERNFPSYVVQFLDEVVA